MQEKGTRIEEVIKEKRDGLWWLRDSSASSSKFRTRLQWSVKPLWVAHGWTREKEYPETVKALTLPHLRDVASEISWTICSSNQLLPRWIGHTWRSQHYQWAADKILLKINDFRLTYEGLGKRLVCYPALNLSRVKYMRALPTTYISGDIVPMLHPHN